MDKLVIQGFVCRDWDGSPAVKNGYNKESIVSKIEDFASNVGWYARTSRGLGGSKSMIDNANVRFYVTEEECKEEEAMSSLIDKMYGTITTTTHLVGYSEYTITGCVLDDFSIGGHDLEQEIMQYRDKFITLIIEA